MTTLKRRLLRRGERFIGRRFPDAGITLSEALGVPTADTGRYTYWKDVRDAAFVEFLERGNLDVATAVLWPYREVPDGPWGRMSVPAVEVLWRRFCEDREALEGLVAAHRRVGVWPLVPRQGRRGPPNVAAMERSLRGLGLGALVDVTDPFVPAARAAEGVKEARSRWESLMARKHQPPPGATLRDALPKSYKGSWASAMIVLDRGVVSVSEAVMRAVLDMGDDALHGVFAWPYDTLEEALFVRSIEHPELLGPLRTLRGRGLVWPPLLSARGPSRKRLLGALEGMDVPEEVLEDPEALAALEALWAHLDG